MHSSMSSIGKACLELSRSIKGFRFSRSPTDQKDFAVHNTSLTTKQTSTTPFVGNDVTQQESVQSQVDSVTNTISRVLRSATNRVRSFPSGGEHRNGHSSPTATCAPPSTVTAAYFASPTSPPAPASHLHGPDDLWQDEKFLFILFRYFAGTSELCVLAQVCRRWRDVLYRAPPPPDEHLWVGITPIVSCKQLQTRTEEERMSFYRSIELRGFDSVCLVGAVDADVRDMASGEFPYWQTEIVHLTVRSSNLSDKGLEALLALMTRVTSLELTGCNEITEAGLWHCLDARITRLGISDCINVADDTLGAVSQLLPALRELNLQAYHVTDSALAAFSARQSASLHVLRLNSCWEITNHGVVNVVRTLPCLTVLSLSGCSKVTDDGVEVIAENLRQLRSLDLSWCSRVTDAALECIACDLGQLEELTLDR